MFIALTTVSNSSSSSFEKQNLLSKIIQRACDMSKMQMSFLGSAAVPRPAGYALAYISPKDQSPASTEYDDHHHDRKKASR